MSDPADYEHEFHDRCDPTCADGGPFDMPLETLVGACKVCHPPRKRRLEREAQERSDGQQKREARDPIREGLNRDLTAPVVYHPDPDTNAGIIEDAIAAEMFDVSIGYPPRSWRCPDCSTAHGRGSFLTIGTHRCLACGYVGTGGVMFGTSARMAS